MSTPTLVYDDDCGFCTWWADQFDSRTDLAVVGFSELDDDLLARLPEDYESSSHLVTEDAVYSGGESLEQASLHTSVGDDLRPLVSFLRNFEDYGEFREGTYRWVAENRDKLGTVVSKRPPARDRGDGD